MLWNRCGKYNRAIATVQDQLNTVARSTLMNIHFNKELRDSYLPICFGVASGTHLSITFYNQTVVPDGFWYFPGCLICILGVPKPSSCRGAGAMLLPFEPLPHIAATSQPAA